MSKKLKVIREDAIEKDPDSLQDRQRQKLRTDRLTNKKSNSATPKNNASVFSAKPEPNRGPGTDRHPNVPRAKRTRPLGEDGGGAVSIGSGAVAGITDPTTNYAFQVLKKKQQKMARRKKPIGEAARPQKQHHVPIKDFDIWKGRAEKAGYHVSKVKHVDPNDHVYVAHKRERDDKENPDGRGPAYNRVRGHYWHNNQTPEFSHGYLRYKYIPEEIIVEKKEFRRITLTALKDKLAEEVNYKNTIFLIRHGRTALDAVSRSDGWLDFPLTDDGRRGLIQAQQYLKNIPVSHIYAPTLKRTQETGDILSSGIIANPKVVSADEAKTWNLGTLTGTTKKPNKPIVTYYMDHPEETPPGGESMGEFEGRFLPWLEKIKKESLKKESPVLVVLSGSNLRSIGQHMYNDKRELDLDEGGLATLQFSDGKWKGKVLFGHKDEAEEYLS